MNNRGKNLADAELFHNFAVANTDFSNYWYQFRNHSENKQENMIRRTVHTDLNRPR